MVIELSVNFLVNCIFQLCGETLYVSETNLRKIDYRRYFAESF